MHRDRRTDGQSYLTKLIFALRNFANAPNERPEPGCVSICPEVTLKIVLKLKRGLCELRTITFVTTAEKLSVTIDKG
jgi:hypothetical protein